MAEYIKIVELDQTDDWNQRTVQKLNYDLKSLREGIIAARETGSVSIGDVLSLINDNVGNGQITITQGGSSWSFTTNDSYDHTIELSSGGGGGGGNIDPDATTVLKGDGNGNAISIVANDLPHVTVNGSESLVFYPGAANVT